MQHFKLVVSIRCHLWPKLVLDTVSAVFHHSRTFPLVVLASDANPRIGPVVQEKFPQVRVFTAPGKWGWGAGLYGLLSDTISWLDGLEDISYEHFLTIDYDTIPIGPDFDGIILRQLAKHPTVGLAGSHIRRSANWESNYRKSEHAIKATFNGHCPDQWPPPNYHPGESCLGGFMWLTKGCLADMRRLGFFRNPFRDIRGRIDLVDDPWTALLVRAAGWGIFDIKSILDYGHISYQSAGNWRQYPARGLRVFNLGHISRPTDKTDELLTRNHFRRIRREKYLLTTEDGRP